LAAEAALFAAASAADEDEAATAAANGRAAAELPVGIRNFFIGEEIRKSLCTVGSTRIHRNTPDSANRRRFTSADSLWTRPTVESKANQGSVT
jgi:hypothetical protein